MTLIRLKNAHCARHDALSVGETSGKNAGRIHNTKLTAIYYLRDI